MVKDPEALAKSAQDAAAVAEGVFFTRDLVNEPANVLTTTDFADRLLAMQEIGLEVEVLDEDQLAKLWHARPAGRGPGQQIALKVVVMHWNGGGDEAPWHWSARASSSTPAASRSSRAPAWSR